MLLVTFKFMGWRFLHAPPCRTGSKGALLTDIGPAGVCMPYCVTPNTLHGRRGHTSAGELHDVDRGTTLST
jgi:hypothetical protein